MIRFVRPSKTVTNAQKVAAALEAASIEIAPDVAPALVKTFDPWVREGESPPAQEEFRQALLGRWLRQVRERLVAADEAHQREVRAERSLRRRRDRLAATAESAIRAIRTTFEKVYGAGLTAEVVGLASDIPEDPVVLERYAKRVVDVMSEPDLDLPRPRVKGSTMGPAEVIEEISPLQIGLSEVLDQLEPQKRRTQVALRQKREALEAFNYATGRVARYLEALCFLAGMDFHAERVRQTSHGRLEEDDSFQPDEGEPESDDESPPEDAETSESA